MSKRVRPTQPSAVLGLPVLITEFAEEFEHLQDALKDELKPRGVIEHLLVDEIAEKAWDVRRLRSVKANLINSAFRRGLRDLIKQILPRPEDLFHFEREVDGIASQWFGNERDKKEVLQLLESYSLGEHAIEAAAVQHVVSNLETIDRLMASAESRLNKTMRMLAELRDGLGRQLHRAAERILDGKVLAIDDASKQSPPAAA